MSDYRPSEVRIKRRKGDEAPRTLILESGKRSFSSSGDGDGHEDGGRAKKRHTSLHASDEVGGKTFTAAFYQKKVPNERKIIAPLGVRKASSKVPKQTKAGASDAATYGKPQDAKRKIFKLEIGDEASHQDSARQSKRRMPTLVAEGVESGPKTDKSNPAANIQGSTQAEVHDSKSDIPATHAPGNGSKPGSGQSQPPPTAQAANPPERTVKDQHKDGEESAQVFKRPGRSSGFAKRERKPTVPSGGDQGRMTSLANQLHEFALEVSAEEKKKPKSVVSKPRLSAQRSREIHQERMRRNLELAEQSRVNTNMDVDSDGEYVYETYKLVDSPADRSRLQSEMGDVGYIVITAEDQPFWEEFMDDDKSDKDWNSEEEDENGK